MLYTCKFIFVIILIGSCIFDFRSLPVYSHLKFMVYFDFSVYVATYFSQSGQDTAVKHQCPFCPYSTNKISHFQVHKRKHTGEKPYRCDICSKLFSQKSNLQTHYRSHLGQRPFSCANCNKSFAQKVSLLGHIRICPNKD